MKNKTFYKKMSYLLTAALLVGVLNISPIGSMEVKADEPAIKNVNLNVGNSIAGIKAPFQPTYFFTPWTGTKVYFGNNLYFVLDKDGTNGYSSLSGNMLLLSAQAIGSACSFGDNSDWKDSPIRNSLNGDGLYSLLTPIEQSVISNTTISQDNSRNDGETTYPTTSESKIFLLDWNDVNSSAYGFIPREGGSSTREISSGYWWLRSPSGYAKVLAVDSNGSHNGMHSCDDSYYVRPALNITLSSISHTSAIGVNKTLNFTTTEDAPSVGTTDHNIWNLTLKDGNNQFAAQRMTDGNELTGGSTVKVKVTSLGDASVSANYTQISAMLLSADNTILAYGKIGNAVENAIYDVNIPSEVTGTKLYVFAEDVNSVDGGGLTTNLTDYASEMVAVTDRSVPPPQPDPNNSSTTTETVQNPTIQTKEDLICSYPAYNPNCFCAIDKQGPLCVKAFQTTTPEEYTEAFSFNLFLRENGAFCISYTKKTGEFILFIPKKYQREGRTFAIIGIDSNGITKIFTDTDTNNESITVMLDVEGYAFSAIYTDNVEQ